MMRFKIEEIKELEIELKEVESEQTIKKKNVKNTTIRL